MARLNLPIYEHQTGVFHRIAEGIKFLGRDQESGLYVFEENGKRDLYARRFDPPAGWHLQRGAYAYEFCRSAHGILS